MAGKFGFGTKFSATMGGSLTEVAELTGIKGVEITADDLDVSSNDNADGYREFAQGLLDAGTIDIEGNFTNDASQKGLKTLMDLGTTVAMSIAFPDSLATWTFNAYVNKVATDSPMDDKLGFSASLKISGKPTLA